MEKETLKPKSPSHNVKGSIHALSHTFDLPALVEKMKQKPAWVKGELNAMILLKSTNKEIVLATLHEGTEINSFHSNDSITLQILEGKLKFRNRKESVTLDKGQLLVVQENINFSLTTGEETVFLLTIASSVLQQA